MKSKLFAAAVCLSALCAAEPVDELERTSTPPAPVRLDLGQLEWNLPKNHGTRVGDAITIENSPAFREYKGWSVEHEFKGRVNNRDMLEESADNPRKRALLEEFKRNKGTP